MNIPKQVAPVERTITPSAISEQNGVEASGWLDQILKAVEIYGPTVAQTVGSLLR